MNRGFVCHDSELNAVSDLPENISSLSTAELRTALSVSGPSAKRSKKALISRLVKHLEQLKSLYFILAQSGTSVEFKSLSI